MATKTQLVDLDSGPNSCILVALWNSFSALAEKPTFRSFSLGFSQSDLTFKHRAAELLEPHYQQVTFAHSETKKKEVMQAFSLLKQTYSSRSELATRQISPEELNSWHKILFWRYRASWTLPEIWCFGCVCNLVCGERLQTCLSSPSNSQARS